MEIEIYNHTSQYLLRYNSTSFSLRYLFDHRQTPAKLSFKKPSSREERKLKVSKERRKEKKERESERGKRRKEICRLTTLRFTTPSYRLTYRRQWRREEARVARAERARIDSDSSGELSALWRLSRGFLPPSAATWGRRGSLGARLVVLVAAVHEEEARTRSQGSLSGAFHRFHGDRRARAARPRAGACAYPPASGGNRFWPSPTPEQPGTTERRERKRGTALRANPGSYAIEIDPRHQTDTFEIIACLIRLCYPRQVSRDGWWIGDHVAARFRECLREFELVGGWVIFSFSSWIVT